MISADLGRLHLHRSASLRLSSEDIFDSLMEPLSDLSRLTKEKLPRQGECMTSNDGIDVNRRGNRTLRPKTFTEKLLSTCRLPSNLNPTEIESLTLRSLRILLSAFSHKNIESSEFISERSKRVGMLLKALTLNRRDRKTNIRIGVEDANDDQFKYLKTLQSSLDYETVKNRTKRTSYVDVVVDCVEMCRCSFSCCKSIVECCEELRLEIDEHLTVTNPRASIQFDNSCPMPFVVLEKVVKLVRVATHFQIRNDCLTRNIRVLLRIHDMVVDRVFSRTYDSNTNSLFSCVTRRILTDIFVTLRSLILSSSDAGAVFQSLEGCSKMFKTSAMFLESREVVTSALRLLAVALNQMRDRCDVANFRSKILSYTQRYKVRDLLFKISQTNSGLDKQILLSSAEVMMFFVNIRHHIKNHLVVSGATSYARCVGSLAVVAAAQPGHDIVLRGALPVMVNSIVRDEIDKRCVLYALRTMDILLAPFKSRETLKRTAVWMARSTDIFDALSAIISHGGLRMRDRFATIVTSSRVISMFVAAYRESNMSLPVFTLAGTPPGRLGRATNPECLLNMTRLIEVAIAQWKEWIANGQLHGFLRRDMAATSAPRDLFQIMKISTQIYHAGQRPVAYIEIIESTILPMITRMLSEDAHKSTYTMRDDDVRTIVTGMEMLRTMCTQWNASEDKCLKSMVYQSTLRASQIVRLATRIVRSKVCRLYIEWIRSNLFMLDMALSDESELAEFVASVKKRRTTINRPLLLCAPPPLLPPPASPVRQNVFSSTTQYNAFGVCIHSREATPLVPQREEGDIKDLKTSTIDNTSASVPITAHLIPPGRMRVVSDHSKRMIDRSTQKSEWLHQQIKISEDRASNEVSIIEPALPGDDMSQAFIVKPVSGSHITRNFLSNTTFNVCDESSKSPRRTQTGNRKTAVPKTSSRDVAISLNASSLLHNHPHGSAPPGVFRTVSTASKLIVSNMVTNAAVNVPEVAVNNVKSLSIAVKSQLVPSCLSTRKKSGSGAIPLGIAITKIPMRIQEEESQKMSTVEASPTWSLSPPLVTLRRMQTKVRVEDHLPNRMAYRMRS